MTAEQRAEFEERGFFRLRAVFSRAEAERMQERVWATLERKHGVRRDDPGSWRLPPAAGLQALRTHAVFHPIGAPAVIDALDHLIGEGCWQRPRHWGQFLVSFPAAGPSAGRTPWHTDFPYVLDDDRVAGALVFSFIGEVPARAGGTLVLAGSHRLVARFLRAKPHLRQLPMKVTRRALMDSDPWLKSLCAESDPDEWSTRLLDTGHVIADVPLRIVELVGEAGDVVVGHPWLLHRVSHNRGDQPRFMRVQRIRALR